MAIEIKKTSRITNIKPGGKLLTFEEIIKISPQMFYEHFKKFNNLILSEEVLPAIEQFPTKMRRAIVNLDVSRKLSNERLTALRVSSSDCLSKGNARTIKSIYITGIRYGI